jgi:hypothetical protein
MTAQQEIPNEYKVLQEGQTIASTHKVVSCTRISERVEGDSYASWVALCENTVPYSYHKWVTWIIAARPEGWSAGSGHYFRPDEWESALANYETRGGLLSQG